MVDWRALIMLSVLLFAISVLGMANVFALPMSYAIILNGAGFAVVFIYIFLSGKQGVKVQLTGSQPLPGNVVGELVGSALVAYGLKEVESQ
jgi:hypothetical protein